MFGAAYDYRVCVFYVQWVFSVLEIYTDFTKSNSFLFFLFFAFSFNLPSTQMWHKNVLSNFASFGSRLQGVKSKVSDGRFSLGEFKKKTKESTATKFLF